MFDLHLLVDLPKPSSIDTTSLSLEDAAAKLRRAACLRLNGAQSILLHYPKDIELAVELLDDAAVLFDMSFKRLTGMPAQRLHKQFEQCHSIPSVKGCPGIRTPWDKDFAEVIQDGVGCAESWLSGSPSPLWWALAHNRKRHAVGDYQEAFEAGFVSRLQQALMVQAKTESPTSTCFDA
ncbi:hypothetical protein GNF76_28405 [Pseudomonas sp. CCM 7893]|uniref:LasR-specific antiactivator QslA domain-containing protein n=1 Tax=Pseudomonas spelaei TaxID=1055469 RepID=A0A6I3WJ77_9PSED|nr:LasR-specific antiactivator QslA [Pseudomonas spelaei]MUF08261.1 hypothetical protein [Pseudomonas spelaei]